MRFFTVVLLSALIIRPSVHAQDADGAYRVTGGVTPPKLLESVNPKYSEEGRRGHASGVVVVRIIVTTEGRASKPLIVLPMGFGLDEKALETLTEWKFKPGEKDGNPVPVQATLELRFRFLSKDGTAEPSALIFPTGPDSTRPVLLKYKAPTFPAAEQHTGPLLVDLEVAANGRARFLNVVKGSTDAGDAVAAVLDSWRFEPGVRNGLPVSMKGRLLYGLGGVMNGPVTPPEQ